MCFFHRQSNIRWYDGRPTRPTRDLWARANHKLIYRILCLQWEQGPLRSMFGRGRPEWGNGILCWRASYFGLAPCSALTLSATVRAFFASCFTKQHQKLLILLLGRNLSKSTPKGYQYRPTWPHPHSPSVIFIPFPPYQPQLPSTATTKPYTTIFHTYRTILQPYWWLCIFWDCS